MTPAEAEAALQRDPANVSTETATALRRAHGEDGYQRMLHEARSNVRVQTSNKVTFDYANYGSGWQPVRPAGTPGPAPTSVPQEPYRQPGSVDPEIEFYENPIGASAATRQLLRARWGNAEYNKRLREAVARSGQASIKVTR